METQQTIAENVQPGTEKPNLNDELKAKVTTQYLTIKFYRKRYIKKPLLRDGKVFIFHLLRTITFQPRESITVNTEIKIYLPKKIEGYVGFYLLLKQC